jgi:hypothetical protein
MNTQKNESLFQVKLQQADIADLSDEQTGIYELSDEQLASVHGAGGGGGDPTALVTGIVGGLGIGSLLGGGK